MRKTTKIWIVIAASLVFVGLIMFAAVMSEYKWDFSKLSTGKYETNTYEISEEFSNLSMNTDTADIIFALSDDGKCRVECYEEEKAKHSVAVQENTLVIKMIDERTWYDYIGINFGSPKITVYLPKAEYASLFIKESTGDIEIPKNFKFEGVDISSSTGDVNFFASASKLIKIRTSTGNVCVENTSAETLDLSASTGRITVSNVICGGDANINVSTGRTNLNNIECKNLTSSGDTGDISLNHVIAAEKFSIKRSTGDVRFDGSDAAETLVETDTGDVTGTFLSEKIFFVETDTGSVDVPESITGGRCEITTDTGDIELDIQ
ncbi:MAG: DUF4097 family beta strand repeat-containing protein [Acutalibacteraceae bacterium]|jgi:DUF4097 and DUF4098 domain-containing protein YvlB